MTNERDQNAIEEGDQDSNPFGYSGEDASDTEQPDAGADLPEHKPGSEAPSETTAETRFPKGWKVSALI
ncbi:hypothetical protein scyTo_0000901 [Scyliorhinus torazame]|uniref:Uncharacterized protein n=1 Tax=Scyliorhinus torazame TaxID=75743 RepID=A0A401P604_SCYTO|nr:hypothetical protein [Scyliorhinus torazame]